MVYCQNCGKHIEDRKKIKRFLFEGEYKIFCFNCWINKYKEVRKKKTDLEDFGCGYA
jgi:hypothetical protein